MHVYVCAQGARAGVVYTHVHVSARVHVRLYSTRSNLYTVSSGLVVIGARAAGASWTLMTASAPWAARKAHTSVIDAAGNIYVLGGNSLVDAVNASSCNDVWRSADQGAALLQTMHAHLAMCGRVHQCVREASALPGIDR